MLRYLSRLLVIALLALPLASCGKKGNPALVGEWEGKVNGKTVVMTFAKDGELTLGGDIASLGTLLRSFAILTEFNLTPGKNTPITYRCVSATEMEVEADLSVLMEKLSAGGKGDPPPSWKQKLHPKETLTFAVAGKQLTLTNDQGASVQLQRAE